MKTITALAALLALALGAGCASQTATPPAAAPAGWTLAWSDEFDGAALDRSKWATRNCSSIPTGQTTCASAAAC
jgi:hypothetical protein